MSRAHFRVYAELNDFLPPSRRFVTFAHPFHGRPSVKDVIESLGVPHTEVDLVLADGESVGFSWRLHDGARVSVYPMFEAIDVARVVLFLRDAFGLGAVIDFLLRFTSVAVIAVAVSAMQVIRPIRRSSWRPTTSRRSCSSACARG